VACPLNAVALLRDYNTTPTRRIVARTYATQPKPLDVRLRTLSLAIAEEASSLSIGLAVPLGHHFNTIDTGNSKAASCVVGSQNTILPHHHPSEHLHPCE
jgi:hypothetical protein